MHIRSSMFLTLAVAALSLSGASGADIVAPPGAKFEIRLDVAAIHDTEIGQKLIRAVQLMAAEEIGDEQDADKAFAAIEQALGFDPVEEIRSVTLYGTSFEDPEEGLQAVIEMKSTTGNIEGLLLALPGYDSSEHDDQVIHSVAPEEDLRIFGAIHDGRRSKHIVVATSKDEVESMLDSLDDDRPSSPSDVGRGRDRNGSPLIAVRLLELPKLDDLEGPPEALLKMVKAGSIDIRGYGEDLEIEINVESDTEKHAEQLFQLAQGAAAMVSLASDSEEDDEELKMVARVLETLDAEHDKTSVHLRVKLSQALVIEFLREEADLPLNR